MAQPRPAVDSILGQAPKIEALRAQIARIVAFDAPGNPRVPTVLLQGETGTGKGLVARVLHDSGPRAAGPFVDVNCAAIPEAMLEAELFGFEAGAFTDARRAKPGLFESASGGTLFLDEIDSMSAAVQSKVLKAIEEKTLRRLGSLESYTVDVKLIAATQRDLANQVERGAFRADLFHRLALLVLAIPPLRERENDAVFLAEAFLESYAGAHGVAPKRLSEEAREWLRRHPWPGNVRELGHLMERVTLLCLAQDVGRDALDELCIETSRSPAAAQEEGGGTPAASGTPDASPDDAERVRAALVRTGGNVLRAARLLGIGRNALRYRMRRLGIERSDVISGAVPAARRPAAGTTTARITMPAAAPPPPAPADEPSWEPKAVAVLVLSASFPESAVEAPDYEPWTAAMRWDRSLAERIEGFGGVLLHRTPSRFTAVFGIPRALEQAALRAVQAGRAVQRAAVQAKEPRPEIRAAVHVGDVRFDTRADDPVAGLLPTGEVLALPERLLGHAGPDELLVTPAAARRIDRIFELEPRAVQLGPRPSDRLETHRVAGLRVRSEGEPAAARDAAPIFVGREAELDLLSDAFARAQAGHGEVAFVAGDAGIGKSRLLAELRRRIADRPHRWVEGRCAPYADGTPFFPIIDGLRRYLDIDDSDDERTATAKIAAEVKRLGPDLAWTLPFVQQVLSLEVGDEGVRSLDSASRRSELFRALRALTLRTAEIEPLVLVVEDLHWIDPASEEYLSFVGEVIPTTRALLVLSYRSGYTHPFGDRSYHRRVALAPLPADVAVEMTGSILGTAEIPGELRSLIAEKAEGNPFFVEELTKSLLEDGSLRRENGRILLARRLDEISVPDTIQDVLVARIDRLAEESKRAIQIAAVIGREFALRLLARITEAGDEIRTQVDELRGVELIYEKAMHPELAYMFKHALTHDVAYESVVRERRKALHRTIGSAVEELYADRLAEHYETLAHHFSRGEQWDKALTYHERSADKAAETYANHAVVHHCRQALEIAKLVEDRLATDVRCRLEERLGRARFYLSEFGESGAAFENAADHCEDPARRSLLLGDAALAYFWAHRYDACRRCNERALQIAGQENAPAGEAMAAGVQSFWRGVLDGELDEFERGFRHSLEICSRHPNEEVEAFALHELALVAEWTGDYPHAIQLAEKAILLGRKNRRPDHIILPTWFLGKALCCTGDYGRAIALLEQAHDLCERIGDRAWRSRLLNTLGWCFAEVGDVERARTYNERAAGLARQIGDPEILSNASINLALNHIALGAVDEALRHLEPIESDLARPGDPWMRWRYSLHALDARARVALAAGDPETALASARAELDGARRHRAPKIEARASLRQGEALLTMDRREETDEAARRSLAAAERIRHPRGQWQALLLIAEGERRAGQPERARAHAARAEAIVERAVRTLADESLRQRLKASLDRAG